jgi:hypothetical protein
LQIKEDSETFRLISRNIWSYIQDIESSRRGRTVYNQPDKEKELFELILTRIPHTRGKFNILDLSDFISDSSFECHTQDDFKNKLTEFFKGKEFHIYFQLGRVNGFDDGYNLGTGELCSFNSLPTNIRDYVSYKSKVDLGREITQDWFMRIDIVSLGKHNSLETAIQQARTNVSIYKAKQQDGNN